MKLKFKLKGMVVEVKELPQGLSIIIQAVPKQPTAISQAIPAALEQRIQGCKTLRELLELLFATPDKNEAVMALFDLKMQALEEEGFSISTPFKQNNHGSLSPGKFA